VMGTGGVHGAVGSDEKFDACQVNRVLQQCAQQAHSKHIA
jgi:hypothetical protein